MADDNNIFNDNFGDFKKNLGDIRKESKKVEESVAGWYEQLKKIGELNQNIKHIEEEISKAKAEQKAYAKENKEDLDKIEAGLKGVTGNELKRLKAIELQNKALGKQVDVLEDHNKELGKQSKNLAKSVKEANKLTSVLNSAGSAVKGIGKAFGKVKGLGIFEMDKEIRNAARSMGVGGKNYKAFADNMLSASDSTTMMGVNVKSLAKMQQSYSKEIGRSVMLTEQGLGAMAEMAEGTGLGEQYAVGMSAAMDNFGMSTTSARDLVEETMNIAGEMGVNAEAASEALQKNLKVAQKYNFKGGVKALGKMAAEAVRLKLDMDGIAGLADKVFRPEGAIEMAAKLSVMGGEFAKLGDPMQLMFKARNDFEGFAKDIGKATSEFVEFNKESGSFEVSGGLGMDRMREISNITGIAVEQLQEMAVQQKKIDTIGGSLAGFDKDDKDLIGSLAEWNDNENRFEVTYVDETGKTVTEGVKELRRGDADLIKKQQQTLKERAKQARTFDEVIGDLTEVFKQTLVPFAIALKDVFGTKLQGMIKKLSDKNVLDGIRSFAESVGTFVSTIGGWFADNPIGTLTTALVGWGALKTLTWIANGKALRIGFMSGGPLGAGGGAGGPKGSGFRSDYKTARKAGFNRRDSFRESRNLNRGRGMGGRMAGGIGLGLGAQALDYGRSTMDDPESGMGKAAGIGASALNGAAMGMMLGPWGALVGGLLGGAYGAYKEFSDPVDDSMVQHGDVIMRSGQAPIGIDSKDDVLAIKKGGAVDKVMGNTNIGNTSNGNSTVNHKFEDINITLKFEGLSDDLASKIIDQPRLREMINNAILATRANVSSGGKMSPNPTF
jgi:hypothetical protein